MSTETKRVYLGDGLEAGFDGYQVILAAEREGVIHWVALEPPVFEALIQYAISIGWLEKGQVLQ